MELIEITAEERNQKGFDLINWREKVEDKETKNNLYKIHQCSGFRGNYRLNEKPTIKDIEKIRDLISKYFGTLTYYQLWFSRPIKSWRLVFYRK